MYHYNAIITAVYDGDTLTADIDLGLRVWQKKVKLRLMGVNTPEVRGTSKTEGKRVRDIVRKLVLNQEVEIFTHKDRKGKYGRWLADIFFKHNDQTIHLNQYLLDEGLGKAYARP